MHLYFYQDNQEWLKPLITTTKQMYSLIQMFTPAEDNNKILKKIEHNIKLSL